MVMKTEADRIQLQERLAVHLRCGEVDEFNKLAGAWDRDGQVPLEIRKKRFDFAGIDISNQDLRRANLAWMNLSGANLSGCDLNDVRLNRTNLQGANLRGANLAGAIINHTKLKDADMRGAVFQSDYVLNVVQACGATMLDEKPLAIHPVFLLSMLGNKQGTHFYWSDELDMHQTISFALPSSPGMPPAIKWTGFSIDQLKAVMKLAGVQSRHAGVLGGRAGVIYTPCDVAAQIQDYIVESQIGMDDYKSDKLTALQAAANAPEPSIRGR